MENVDLNLLAALDALLAEGSVTGAARRLHLSASAMSRTLARLRRATGDPLLVRAGRSLVPTPRAAALRGRVHELMREIGLVLAPQPQHLDVASLERTFTIRAGEGFVALFSGPLALAVADAAPGVCLRFAPKPLKESGPLRDGEADLEIGTAGIDAPEVRTQLLFRDGFVGIAREHHPILADTMTAERYAACRHVVASRRGAAGGPIDDALARLGLTRRIAAIVPGFPDAMRVAGQSDLLAAVPGSCLGFMSTQGDPESAGLRDFVLPVETPDLAVSAMWHPRLDADPAQRWLRRTVLAVCRAATASRRPVAPAVSTHGGRPSASG
ncbi:MAG: LysR family transcriptional regulator [Gluconacetobacter diazotrophicus]|nr:LysR family transcriptional regulator [Gluconacetobacter diazotrophicus]